MRRNGKANGKGVYHWANGEVYDGEWSKGVKEGYGMWMEEVIRGSKTIYNHFDEATGNGKDTNHNYFGFYDWQMLSLTKQSEVYGTGTDKLTLYINDRHV